MTRSSSSQRAGDDATQIQAQTVIIGIDEKRAREIFQEEISDSLERFTSDAQSIGKQRADEFGERLIQKLIAADKLNSFAEPAFQVLLTKAQLGAAQTDDPSDYDMLANILADRARVGDERNRRLAIERAVEVADKVDFNALRAMTVLYLLQKIVPNSPDADHGLMTQNSLYELILNSSPLPMGREWIDHLDLIDAVRSNSMENFKSFRDYYPLRMSGYWAKGCEVDDDYAEVLLGFERRFVHVPVEQHRYHPSRVRLPYARPEEMSDRIDKTGLFTTHQRTAIMAYASRWFGLSNEGDPDTLNLFMNHLREKPALANVMDWWDQVPQAVTITDVGQILARAYAEQCGVDELVTNWDDAKV